MNLHLGTGQYLCFCGVSWGDRGGVTGCEAVLFISLLCPFLKVPVVGKSLSSEFLLLQSLRYIFISSFALNLQNKGILFALWSFIPEACKRNSILSGKLGHRSVGERKHCSSGFLTHNYLNAVGSGLPTRRGWGFALRHEPSDRSVCLSQFSVCLAVF